MGQYCAKIKNPNYIRQTEENVLSPFYQIDIIKFPVYSEFQLKFYGAIDDFSILNNILLSDFMTLLNNFTKNEESNSNKNRNIKTDSMNKIEWKKFCENKILNHPIVKLDILMSFKHMQFFDDISDDIRIIYGNLNGLDPQDESIEIPKIAYFSIGFNYCYFKLSQKVLILLSLFADNNNKITLTDEINLFFYLIISNVFNAVIRFLSKELGSSNNFLGIKHSEEADKILNLNKSVVMKIVIDVSDKLKEELFVSEEDPKVYTREEFKKTILEEKFIWIFSNKGIKMKIEEALTRKNIGVSNF